MLVSFYIAQVRSCWSYLGFYYWFVSFTWYPWLPPLTCAVIRFPSCRDFPIPSRCIRTFFPIMVPFSLNIWKLELPKDEKILHLFSLTHPRSHNSWYLLEHTQGGPAYVLSNLCRLGGMLGVCISWGLSKTTEGTLRWDSEESLMEGLLTDE